MEVEADFSRNSFIAEGTGKKFLIFLIERSHDQAP